MKPSEIRALLLSQHAGIRELAARVIEAAQRGDPGPLEPASTLRRAVDALGAAVEAHNRDEQRMLESVLPTADAWGAVRHAAMDAHHRGEHASLRAALAASTNVDDPTDLAAYLQRLVTELLSHMDVEERVILHPSVLRDDACTIDTFGG